MLKPKRIILFYDIIERVKKKIVWEQLRCKSRGRSIKTVKYGNLKNENKGVYTHPYTYPRI